MASHTRQRGQVLVMGMLLAALLGVAWLHFFGTGQVLAAKTRLQHGLDAAAYSAALVQARTLNLLSYLNRAHLAHQLAMAHLITLGSWAHFGGSQAQRLAMGNPPAYLIGMFFGPEHALAYASAAKAVGMQQQAQASAPLGQAYAAHEAFVHDQIATFSRALVRDLPQARLAALQAVLQAQYPELGAEALQPQISNDGWAQLLEERAPDAPLFQLVRRIAASYEFLQPRNYTARNPWMVSWRCPELRHELRRRGATEIDEFGRWSAADTESYHALRSNKYIGCYYREYVMGWAWLPAAEKQAIGGQYSEQPPADFSAQDFWRWVRASTDWDLLSDKDNPLANSYAMRDRQAWPSRGLAAYQDVAAGSSPQAVAGFDVGLRLPADAKTGVSISARSSAETLFQRPERRADGLDELPNLFHPYWHARLASRLRLPGG